MVGAKLLVIALRFRFYDMSVVAPQPWTKTTVRYLGMTRSGLPGSDLFFGPLTVKR